MVPKGHKGGSPSTGTSYLAKTLLRAHHDNRRSKALLPILCRCNSFFFFLFFFCLCNCKEAVPPVPQLRLTDLHEKSDTLNNHNLTITNKDAQQPARGNLINQIETMRAQCEKLITALDRNAAPANIKAMRYLARPSSLLSCSQSNPRAPPHPAAAGWLATLRWIVFVLLCNGEDLTSSVSPLAPQALSVPWSPGSTPSSPATAHFEPFGCSRCNGFSS